MNSIYRRPLNADILPVVVLAEEVRKFDFFHKPLNVNILAMVVLA